MGDPAGIGPEVTLKSIAAFKKNNQSIILMGPIGLLDQPYYQQLISENNLTITTVDSVENINDNGIFYVNATPEYKDGFGRSTPASGKACYDQIERANQWCIDGHASAMVTAPIAKTSLQFVSRFTGHTTLLQSLSKSKDVSMCFYSEKLKIILLTIHCALNAVSQKITNQSLDRAYEHVQTFASYCDIQNPKIAVAGLNPHSGEDGMFGTEEVTVIKPWIHSKQNEQLVGPIPPDTLFHYAVKGHYDVVMCMYHDQGLIPLKLLAFDEAVNVSIGLPYIRTSPDHGTAFDIAGLNKANPTSMKNAIELAIRFTQCQNKKSV